MVVNLEILQSESELLKAFLQADAEITPNVSLVYGNPSTGKSTLISHHLQSLKVKYSIIQCDECVSPKILWKRVFHSLQVDSGFVAKADIVYDPLATSSFQGFLKAVTDFIHYYQYKDLHYIVLDRADHMMEGSNSNFTDFVKFQEVTQIHNISIIFITTTLPKVIITSSIPTIIFENYNDEQLQHLLSSNVECHFPSDLQIPPMIETQFWLNYSKLIVDSFFSYTNDILTLRKISRSLWDEFITPIKDGELKPTEFLRVYRRNFKLLSSEIAVTDHSILTIEDNSPHSNLPIVSKFILIAAYIASFNHPKQDWLLFSKLKEFRRSRKVNLSAKKGKVSSRLIEGSSFDLERLLAITHAVYNIDSTIGLKSDVDLITQVANLSNLKLLLKSQNQNYINSRTKWKVSVNFEFIKKLADEIRFPIEEYLIE